MSKINIEALMEQEKGELVWNSGLDFVSEEDALSMFLTIHEIANLSFYHDENFVKLFNPEKQNIISIHCHSDGGTTYTIEWTSMYFTDDENLRSHDLQAIVKINGGPVTVHCGVCNGSGEGMYGGCCGVCKGSGKTILLD